MFIRAKEYGVYINSDDIVRLEAKMFRTSKGEALNSLLAYMRDGDSVLLPWQDVDDLVMELNSVTKNKTRQKLPG